MNTRQQCEFLETARQNGTPLVLATVVETEGSTYSKAGARMLIDGEGRFRGMLSGGCLEGDLAMRSRIAIESGVAELAEYDLSDNDDELWGMGVGCDGLIRVLLQPLSPAAGYEPAATLLQRQGGRRPARSITCVRSADPATRPGATLVVDANGTANFGVDAGVLRRIEAEPGALEPRAALLALDAGHGTIEFLVSRIDCVPRLLVLGAGADAQPVVRFAIELGWFCTVFDHRPAYVGNPEFKNATATVCAPAKDLATAVDLSDFDLAIVMSHHLASDREYLRQLAATDVGYLGLLGPPSRRARLLGELGDAGASLRDRLRGPAGLDLGGRGPAPIALSIVAEMLRYLSLKDQAVAALPDG